MLSCSVNREVILIASIKVSSLRVQPSVGLPGLALCQVKYQESSIGFEKFAVLSPLKISVIGAGFYTWGERECRGTKR